MQFRMPYPGFACRSSVIPRLCFVSPTTQLTIKRFTTNTRKYVVNVIQDDWADSPIQQKQSINESQQNGAGISVEQDEGEEFLTKEGLVEEIDEEDADVDVWLESTQGNLHLVHRIQDEGVVNVMGLNSLDDILTEDFQKIKQKTVEMMGELGADDQYPGGLPHRAVFCSRTLNLRSIKAIGFDMDYTLIHYDVNAWEGRAYEYGLESLHQQGIPVDGLKFDADLVIRGLIVDKELGNLIKVDRFGLVKRGMHGTRMMTPAEIREVYGREYVHLRNEERYTFLNTLFSVSEACLFAQMVDRLDQGLIPMHVGAHSYQALCKMVAKALYRTHVEGRLKEEIIQDPQKYVELEPENAHTLLDMREAGKKLLLITNSDYDYTNKMMKYCYNPFLPPDMKSWREMFDMVIILARKPDFFRHNMSLYEIVTEDGLMRPAYNARQGGLYCGGSAQMVEKALEIEGDDILYVGDHIYSDVALSKLNFRWRTALVLRELELEVDALARGRATRDALKTLLAKKDLVGDLFNQLRLARQRCINGRCDEYRECFEDEEAINEDLAQVLKIMEKLDEAIVPMIEKDGKYFNQRWGYLSRAGVNDKSQIIRQIEKYADIYTSRVSNFLRFTPFAYFRSPAQSMAHDRNLTYYYQQRYARQNGRALMLDDGDSVESSIEN
eukprot:TRINITY_DN4805_c0_g1_i1.p1 TRINITY_DN4805_c0_g1~~TRINITY_DN4805_c0_g1_i1.p1  ORF type:complete len:679 (+),score=92.88 TRINITY_DN4805_c0_g1_i1:39-2039(+)